MNSTSVALEGTFAKRVRWSPCGSLILANLYNGTMGIFENSLNQIGAVKNGGFNDFFWYPWMNFKEESNCCFASVSKDLPIKLYNIKGEQRSSWTAKDHLDQVTTCHSVSISPDGLFVTAGGNASLWCFDITRPGSESLVNRQTVSNRKAKDGQTGIICDIAFRKDSSLVLAACSFDGSIGIYDLRTLKQSPTVKASTCSLFKAHKYGSSQSSFLKDGWSLVSIGRRQGVVKVWDLRKTGGSSVLEYALPLNVLSNQRIYFDVSADDSIIVGCDNTLLELNNGKIKEVVRVDSVISSVSIVGDKLAFSEGSLPKEDENNNGRLNLLSRTEH